MKTKEKVDKGLFGAVGKALDSPDGYLGRAEDVEALLRMSALAVLEAGDSVAKVLEEQGKKVAKELLGEGLMSPVPGWNEPGVIDAFALPYAGVDSTDPHEIMQGLFLEMIDELGDIAELSETPGILSEQWEWQIDATYETYRNIAMGLNPWDELGTGDPDPGPDEYAHGPEGHVHESEGDDPDDDGTPPALKDGELTKTQKDLVERWEDYP